MAVRQAGVWGIDLGQCALKALRLELREGKPVATAFEYIEYPKILSQPDADQDEMTHEALAQFLARNSIKGDSVAISVPGQSGLVRFVKLPPVDQKKIADIVKFEAKQQIPFPLEEVVWDYQALSTGEIVDGLALETEIGLFAMKRDLVNRAIRHFKQVNVEVHLVQMAPVALCNFVSSDLLGQGASPDSTGHEDDRSCIVALDIGTDSSNLVITDGKYIIWQRPIPIGGSHLTRALTKELKLTFAKAEHLKRNAAKSPQLRRILAVLKHVLNDFAAEVQRSLGYFTNTHRDAQIQYMIGLGNGFRLPGLQKFLQEKLHIEVRKFQHLASTAGDAVTADPTFTQNIMSFGVAYGLALQGARQARLQTNLLPHEIRLERIIRGKKPWAVATAASLLIGMSLLALASGMEKSALNDSEIEKNIKKLREIDTQQQAFKAQYRSEEEKLNMHINSLSRIGAGVAERFNWQLLHQYINYAMPKPNGDRLVAMSKRFEPVRKLYWTDDKDAQQAYQLLERMRLAKNETVPAAEAALRDQYLKRNLIQVNVVGINALYSDNLGDFFRKIYHDSNNLTGMSDADKSRVIDFATNPASNSADLASPGWVVEIRCYTYHKAGASFIEHSIVENLRYPNLPKDADDQQAMMRVGQLVGYLNIYKLTTVERPVAGAFELIGRSYLKSLLKPGAPAAVATEGPAPPAAVATEGPAPPAAVSGVPILGVQRGAFRLKKPPIQPAPDVSPPPPAAGNDAQPATAVIPQAADNRREGWCPIGEVASAILGDGAESDKHTTRPVNGRSADLKPADKVLPSVPRTEFVLLFVWREPIHTGAPQPMLAVAPPPSSATLPAGKTDSAKTVKAAETVTGVK